jgi:hypothetical protein
MKNAPLALSLAALSILVLSILACSSPPAADPSHAEASPEPEPALTTDADVAEAPEAEPPRPSCEDGTCFECGQGLCPRGAYCDATAPGGAACAWIQECPGDPSCACLLRVLGSSCTCAAGASGPAVNCS